MLPANWSNGYALMYRGGFEPAITGVTTEAQKRRAGLTTARWTLPDDRCFGNQKSLLRF